MLIDILRGFAFAIFKLVRFKKVCTSELNAVLMDGDEDASSVVPTYNLTFSILSKLQIFVKLIKVIHGWISNNLLLLSSRKIFSMYATESK